MGTHGLAVKNTATPGYRTFLAKQKSGETIKSNKTNKSTTITGVQSKVLLSPNKNLSEKQP